MTPPYRPHVRSLLVIFAGVFVLASALDDLLILRIVSLVLGSMMIAAGGYTIGTRATIATFAKATGWMPTQVHLHDDDDGDTHALIETLSGDVISLEIPAHVAEAGTDQTMHYVLQTLAHEHGKHDASDDD